MSHPESCFGQSKDSNCLHHAYLFSFRLHLLSITWRSVACWRNAASGSNIQCGESQIIRPNVRLRPISANNVVQRQNASHFHCVLATCGVLARRLRRHLQSGLKLATEFVQFWGRSDCEPIEGSHVVAFAFQSPWHSQAARGSLRQTGWSYMVLLQYPLASSCPSRAGPTGFLCWIASLGSRFCFFHSINPEQCNMFQQCVGRLRIEWTFHCYIVASLRAWNVLC